MPNLITEAEGLALHAIGEAVAGGIGKVSPDGENIVQELETFAIDLATGAPAKLVYKLPDEKYQTTFQWEGKTWNFTAEVVDGALHLDAIPQ